MTLKDKIREDMKNAMKAKEKEKLTVLRSLLSDIKKKEIDSKEELNDDQVLSVIRSGVKSREDSVESYKNGGREDLADKEQFEINVLKEYLPLGLSKEDTEKAVVDAIKESGAESMKDMGKVMKLVLAKHGALVEGKVVSAIVKEKLS